MGVEAKQEISKRIIEKRKFAIDTLEQFQEPLDGMNQKRFIEMVLLTYGVGDFRGLGPTEKFNLAMRFLASDLFIQSFYNANGKPTEYGKAVLAEYPQLDISGYEYCGIDSASFFKHLAMRLFYVGENDPNNNPLVLTACYLNTYGRWNEYPPILKCPGKITIRENRIHIENPTGFIPPWGGCETAVTVFKLPWHRIPLRGVKDIV